MHILGKRYIGVFFDPVLACNLRCKMCYFSDSDKRKSLKGIVNEELLEKIAAAFFSRALKLQIGCGAEPTLYKELPSIIRLAKEHKIPYVSITTNGLLLDKKIINGCLDAGLNEITLSVHGIRKETYEYFMANADYERFHQVLHLLTDAKNKYDFKIRINYTMNEHNIEELVDFFVQFDYLKFDVLQLRPIEMIGNSEYNNFDHTKLAYKYDEIIKMVKDQALERKILCIVPSKQQILLPENENTNNIIFDYNYCYIDPKFYWKPDFDINTDTYNSYCKRNQIPNKILSCIFRGQTKLNKKKKHLNYEVN